MGSYTRHSNMDFGTVHAKTTPAALAPAPLPEAAPVQTAALVPVERGSASDTLRVAGRALADETRIYRVDAGIDGLIRETFNDSVGTRVKKDQRLATFYAPEFLAASSGYLAAV